MSVNTNQNFKELIHWCNSNGFGEYFDALCNKHKFETPKDFLLLNDTQIGELCNELGLNGVVNVKRTKFLFAIDAIRNKYNQSPPTSLYQSLVDKYRPELKKRAKTQTKKRMEIFLKYIKNMNSSLSINADLINKITINIHNIIEKELNEWNGAQIKQKNGDDNHKFELLFKKCARGYLPQISWKWCGEYLFAPLIEYFNTNTSNNINRYEFAFHLFELTVQFPKSGSKLLITSKMWTCSNQLRNEYDRLCRNLLNLEMYYQQEKQKRKLQNKNNIIAKDFRNGIIAKVKDIKSLLIGNGYAAINSNRNRNRIFQKESFGLKYQIMKDQQNYRKNKRNRYFNGIRNNYHLNNNNNNYNTIPDPPNQLHSEYPESNNMSSNTFNTDNSSNDYYKDIGFNDNDILYDINDRLHDYNDTVQNENINNINQHQLQPTYGFNIFQQMNEREENIGVVNSVYN